MTMQGPQDWFLFAAGSSGSFIQSTLLTAPTGTFVTTSRTNSIRIRGVGAGGVGGGSTGVGAGGGGGAGAYVESIRTVVPSTGYTYQCGTAGSNPGQSSIFNAGVPSVAFGGFSGQAGGTTAPLCVPGGSGGPASNSVGDITVSGQPGEPGITLSSTDCASGSGGSGPFGAGGQGICEIANAAPGNSPVVFGDIAYGSGGGGAVSNGSPEDGGAPAPGCWIVDEFS